MECTVGLEVRLATGHAGVGSLERTVSAALADVGLHLWRELVSRLEAALPIPTACATCGGRLESDGGAPRPLVALPGEERRDELEPAHRAAEGLTARTYPMGGTGSRPGSDQRAVMR